MFNLKLLKSIALSLVNSKNFKNIKDNNFLELKYFTKFIDDELLNVNVLDIKNTINHYDRLTKCIVFDFESDKENLKGSYSTFYHELGHHIDWELSLVSNNNNFKSMLLKEGYNFLNNIDVSKLVLFLSKEVRASGLSDILSGITLNKYNFRYKHSNKYWLLSETKICFESFAHFFEAYIRQDEFKLSLYKNIFPFSFNMFFNMINNKNSAIANIA